LIPAMSSRPLYSLLRHDRPVVLTAHGTICRPQRFCACYDPEQDQSGLDIGLLLDSYQAGFDGFRRPRRSDGSLSRAARRHLSSQLWMTSLRAFLSRKATGKAHIHTLCARGFSGAPLERHQRGELSQGEAAEMLGVSERTFRRWRDRLRDEGPEGLRDRRIGKPSSRRAAAEEILCLLGLYEERYRSFTVKHFHEQLPNGRRYKLGYTATRLALQRAGLVRPAPRRSASQDAAGPADDSYDAASGRVALRLAAGR
jgi:transposase